MRARLHVDDGGTVARLGRHVGRLRHPQPLYRNLIEDFTRVATGVFRSQGAVLGRRWAPNDPEYAARKTGPVGVNTRTMLRALTSTAAVVAGSTVTRDGFAVGPTVDHAEVFARGRKGQPARPLLPDPDELADRWTPVMARHFTDDGRASRVILP